MRYSQSRMPDQGRRRKAAYPIWVDGVRYATVTEAAKAIGRGESAIFYALSVEHPVRGHTISRWGPIEEPLRPVERINRAGGPLLSGDRVRFRLGVYYGNRV